MLDELKEEEIVNKVGGRFKLSTLIQKRMVALNTGAKPLVDVARRATRWRSSSRRSCRTRSTWTRPGELREREQQLPPDRRGGRRVAAAAQ